MADYDVVIIGAGPAGLTAAIYASRARMRTLVTESFSIPNQVILTDAIENYPGFPDAVSGFQLIGYFKKQAEKSGAVFTAAEVKKIKGHKDGSWQIITENGIYVSLSVIIAAGSRPKKLNVEGEDKLTGKGVSYCATCDGPIYKDKNVIVIGGGDTALAEALFLTRFARKITVIHRRNSLRATKILQERAFLNPKIEFMLDSIVTAIIGSSRVEAVRIKNVRTESEEKIYCEGVFIFTGYMPNTDFVKDVVKVDTDGYIVTDDNMVTSQRGIFACGDCRRKLLRQVVTACGDGATAAFSCQHYLEQQ